MDLGLDGRVALVTGSSQGLGLGVARALAAEGAKVAMTSRSPERIEAAAREVGARARPFVHDSTDLDAVGALIGGIEAELGPIEILVTNTGGPPAGPDPFGFSREQWETAHRSLVLAPLALIGRVLPGMRERGFGRIVNLASTTVREPLPALMLSNTERSAATTALKTIAREVAADGVTVNTILTGMISTDRLIEIFGSREAVEAMARADIPAQRLGTVEELADVVTFLCSSRASYVTAAALPVDGGRLRAV